MPEFACTCKNVTGAGRVVFFVTLREVGVASVSLYGCLRCHRVYFDTPTYPLTQMHIDTGG